MKQRDMSKQDFSKTKFQTCVLRVNIHCDGCKKKVKKVLQKIKGVENVSINAEQGKVVVTGNVDLNTLIKKLMKSGKHAEPWLAKKGFYNENHLNHQFNNMQIGKNGKSGGVDILFHQGNGGGNKPKYGQNMMVVPHKEQKHVKFNMGKDEFDYSDDDFDEFDDDQDDGFDDDDDDLDDYGFDFGKRTPSRKAVKNGSSTPGRAMHKGSVTVHGLKNGKKKSGKKGIFGLFRSLGKKKEKKNGNNGGKKGGVDSNNYNGNSNRKGKDQYQVVPGKKGSKDDGSFTIDCKSGSNRKESNKFKGGYDGNNYNGKNLEGKNSRIQVQPHKKIPPGFDIDVKNHKKGGPRGFGGDIGGEHMRSGGGMIGDNINIGDAGRGMGSANFGIGDGGGTNIMGGGNGHGGYMGQMGPMGNYAMRPLGPMGNHPMGPLGNLPAVQGLPAPVAMNNGYYQGMGPGNPYSQQQYMAMMMNQQQAHGNGMFQPMMYARPQHPMNYIPTTMPPRVSDPYTHMFSDENANACSIM